VSKIIKSNIKEVAQNACHHLQCQLQYDVTKKTELDSQIASVFLSGAAF
jgi:hypothetical protein